MSDIQPPSQRIPGDLSQGAQRPVLKACHFFGPSNKFENFLRITPTLLVFPYCLVSRPIDKFSPLFFFRLRMGTCPLNQNVDNLHKHGELFQFTELLAKFPRISDDIVNYGFRHKNEKNGSSGRKTIQGDTELGRKWWQFRREKEKFKGMKIWIASQETLNEVRQRKKAD